MARTPSPRPSSSQRPRVSLGETDTFPDEISSIHSSHRRGSFGDHGSIEHSPPPVVEFSTEPNAFLPRPSYILWIVALYSCLATTAWVFICVLVYRPLTAPSYSSDYLEKTDGNQWLSYQHGNIASLYNINQRFFRAARVLQSISSGLAIPITSATCSRAAVAFVQRNSRRTRLTMRQTVTLADKGWTSLEIWFRLMKPEGWKRYGSPFLMLAILLNALGFLINPLQEVLLTQKSIKTPVQPFQIEPQLADLYSLIRYQNPSLPGVPGDMDVVNDIELQLLRDVLETTSVTDPQPRLWARTSPQCSGVNNKSSSNDPAFTSQECSGLFTLTNLTELSDPFLAQLTTNTSTGVMRQWLPRLNSSASYEHTNSFPSNCADLAGAFHAQYNENGNSSWNIEACMPTNQLLPVWNLTRQRQDISEKRYLRFNISGQTASFLATINTTAGYFELPNYMTDQSPGELLNVDPESLCSSPGTCQFSTVYVEAAKRLFSRSASDKSSVSIEVGTAATNDELRQVVNKGPLLATAVALFGSGSFIESLQTDWSSLVAANKTSTSPYHGECIGLMPWTFLSAWPYNIDESHNEFGQCIYNGSDPMEQLQAWAYNFGYYDNVNYFTSRADTFAASAFLANEIWLTYYDDSISVSYDLGADHQVPTMSLAGMIVISALLGIYLSFLLAMAFYSCKTGLWTSQFDAFAMLRLGSALSENVPLLLSRDNNKISVLDELPGWVGDGSLDSHVGALIVGAESRLKERKRFTSYENEVEPLTSSGSVRERKDDSKYSQVVSHARDE